MRKTLFASLVTATVLGITAISGTAAFAVEEDPYTPSTSDDASLAGSLAATECVGDVPWIDYQVTLTDPDNEITETAATLRITGSGQSVEIPLGTLVDDSLSGRVLWPGASVGADGTGTGWPGWTNESGVWEQTTGNFAWTRGPITATIHVNPEVVVPLSYPVASPVCANPASESGLPLTYSGEDALASTGSTVSWIAVGVGAAALALGGGLIAARRRRVHN